MTRVRVVRADDLLVCDLEFVGIDIVGASPQRRLVASGAAAALVILHLPFQHVTERAFVDGKPLHFEYPLDARAADVSRIAFRIDPAALPVDYKLPALLRLLAASRLSVPPSAARGPQAGCLNVWATLRWLFNPPVLANPAPTETALELPFRMILAPEGDAGFSHRDAPVPGTASDATRHELWHSQLEAAPDRAELEVRAIWLRQGHGPPWNPRQPAWNTTVSEGTDEPFAINTMSQRNRADIVHVSGNRAYGLQTGTDFEAQPIPVNRMAVSALGAWLDIHGQWDPPDLSPVVDWMHRTTQGRDQYVRIIEQGYMYPFGHRGVKVTITERRFAPELEQMGNPPMLLQRTFIIIREPVKTYAPGAAPPAQAHTMPLREVRFRTLVTPQLKPASTPALDLATELNALDPFLFKLSGTDVDANRIDLATPLVWIRSSDAWTASTIAKAEALYAAWNVRDAHGARLALAPGSVSAGASTGDATYAAQRLAFTAKPRPLPKRDKEPGFWPELLSAVVHAPALQIVAGAQGTPTLAYHDTYRVNGLGGANVNELIAKVEGAALPLSFGDKGDRSGGLMQPDMSIGGISRRLGPVGGAATDLAKLAGGTFEPATFFAGALPKLFGVFGLDEVLAPITGTRPSDVPSIVTQGVQDALAATFDWKPVPTSFPVKDPIFEVIPGTTTMEVTGRFDARTASAPQADIRATLEHFRINLLGGDSTFLILAFEKVQFAVEAGRKPDVDVVIDTITFAGPLSFVEEIKKVIPLDGFSDPPALDITPAGIKASFSLGLPDIAVGVFALQNVSLGAGFSIPFIDGALTVDFNFCTRAEPFLLTVSLFGGGGFFGLALDPHGIQMLEAALEFGASAAINLGVAQGSVHVMAGIYFKIESAKGCTLTGYLRLGGEMSVLGLISASIELNLSFTYKDPDKAYGRAVISVEIDIFLFSMSVEVECERQFAGSSNDPPFEALMPVDAWTEYCGAYA